MGGKRILGVAAAASPRQTPMQTFRDAILAMTWRDLEGLAEMFEDARVQEGGGRDGPITGKILNDWANEIDLED